MIETIQLNVVLKYFKRSVCFKNVKLLLTFCFPVYLRQDIHSLAGLESTLWLKSEQFDAVTGSLALVQSDLSVNRYK